ncbi:MAG: hypothetical protein ACOC0J_00085, partial [Myxococcota bacterium]
VMQLYRPPFGRGGMWSTTFSIAEMTMTHFGLSTSHGGDGRATLVMAAPSVHFSAAGATYTLGLAPMASFTYGQGLSSSDWGGMLVLAGHHRAHPE